MTTTSDPVGVALYGMGTGAFAGSTAITLGLLSVRGIQRADAGTAAQNLQFAVLSGVVIFGVGLAVLVALALTAPLTEAWRRGVTAMLAVFGTAILTTIAAPIDMVGGLFGLGVYAVALTAGTVFVGRGARRVARS